MDKKLYIPKMQISVQLSKDISCIKVESRFKGGGVGPKKPNEGGVEPKKPNEGGVGPKRPQKGGGIGPKMPEKIGGGSKGRI